jgi:hypothetical protein
MFSKISSAISASANKRAVFLRAILAALLIFGAWVYSKTCERDMRSQAVAQTSTTAATTTRPLPDRKADIELLQNIPQSAVLAYVSFSNGGLDETNGRLLTSLLTTASLTGVFNANQQILADAVSGVVLIGKYPHAIFLLNAAAKKLGTGSYTLDGLSVGVVVRADEEAREKFLAFIKQTLDHYFTADNASLVWAGEGKLRHQKLSSDIFPEWCCCEWGTVNETFIFTIGPRAYETVARTILTRKKTLNDETMIQLANEHDNDIDRRMFFAYGDFEGLGGQLRPTMGYDYDKILRACATENTNKVLLSAGFTDRAFISKLYVYRGGVYQLGLLTGDFSPGDWRARAVPPQAGSYGVSYSIVTDAVRYVVDTYLASRNPVLREKLIQNYNRLAGEAGNDDVLKTVFAHMGPMVIIHDWPKHPLGVPLAKTMLVEHDGDSNLRANWEKTMTTWQAMLKQLNNPSEKGKFSSAWESLFNLQLDRTDSGIWFVHLGPLVLVAAGLDDNFLVLSYAVPAVQANMNYLKTVKRTSAGRSQIPEELQCPDSANQPDKNE